MTPSAVEAPAAPLPDGARAALPRTNPLPSMVIARAPVGRSAA